VHLEQNTTARPDNLPVDPNEGSYQFWWNVDGTDYYYLFFSSGTCCNEPPDLVPQGEEYHVMVCRSTEPTGGFVDQEGNDCLTDNGGTLVLASHDDVYAPGGQGTRFGCYQASIFS
jgi:arabinan endo-1,5-alpha-L-arabinosidase